MLREDLKRHSEWYNNCQSHQSSSEVVFEKKVGDRTPDGKRYHRAQGLCYELIMATWAQALRFVAKLARLKMTIFSAVTYGVAASLTESDRFDPYLFFVGWTFVFFTQLVAHFLGEFLNKERDL